MVHSSYFATILARLLKHRGTEPSELSSASGLPVAELQGILAGTPPLVPQLDLLAPALGFHAADLYLMAGIVVPEALAHRSQTGYGKAKLVATARVLPADRLAHLVDLVEGLPRESLEILPAPPQIFDPRTAGFGAVLVNLLWYGRNLRTRDMATILATLTDLTLSGPTIPAVGTGAAALTPKIAAAFATVLGLPPEDVMAMAGLPLPHPPARTDPRAPEMASLLWLCRHLTNDQLRSVGREANAMLVPVPSDGRPEEWHRVYSVGDVWWGARKNS
ncbi:hypothetical protein [Kitasatospora griseola]|uniref:hypothetical protein n=1 Tax=Kitasatospora griseola TaxID=2064 RepID=UPI00166F7AFC|nr:hypothetical protein [Kitasatospora griseola]GGR07179.1 hypothetical protein GCM10010195_72770 [Kitasatospora griseola]